MWLFLAEIKPCLKKSTHFWRFSYYFTEILLPLKSLVIMVYFVLVRDGHIPQITQVAAMEAGGGKTFNVYVRPTIPISDNAQQVTGIRMVGNTMQVNRNNVDARPLCEALNSFCDWLQSFNNVVLVAHNGRRFDFPVLVTACDNAGLCDKFFHCVAGCVDSLPVFKKVYSDRKSYKQEDIARDLLGASYSAHNASEDAMILGKLVHHLMVLTIDFMPYTFSAKAVYNSQLCSREKAKNMPSLRVLVYNGVCKSTTAENIAGSGLNLQHLKCIFQREGEDGLRNTFIMKNCEGQPRVTNTKRTLDAVVPALANYLSKH
jgi:DNA polymerase III epsilon subunit-like protein